jgi:hypothetical protein
MNQKPIPPKLLQLAAYPLTPACLGFVALLSGLILITPVYDGADARLLLNIVISFCFLRYITGLYAHSIWSFPTLPSFAGLLFNRYWPSFFFFTGLLGVSVFLGQTILSIYSNPVVQIAALFTLGFLFTSMLASIASHGKIRSAFQISAIAHTIRYAQLRLLTPWLGTLGIAAGLQLSLPLLYHFMAPATAWLICLNLGGYLLSLMIVDWAQRLKCLPIPAQQTKQSSAKSRWFSKTALTVNTLNTTSKPENSDLSEETLETALEPTTMNTHALQTQPQVNQAIQPLHTPEAVETIIAQAPRPIQKNKPFVEQIFSLAQYYQQQGQSKKTLATFRYGLSKLPTHQGMLKATIDIALSLKAFKEVLTYGRLAIAELVKERQISAALNLYQEIADQYSGFCLQNPRVIRQLAEASSQAKKWMTVIHLTNQLHQRTNPHDDVAWCYLWLSQAFDTKMNDPVKAKNVLDYLLINYPHHPAMNAIKHYWRQLKAKIAAKSTDDKNQKSA